MNEQNLAYLKDGLKYMGFGESLHPELEKNIQQRFPEFVLKLDTEINKKSFSAVLYFKRGEKSNMYFFNQWQASLKNEAGKRERTFYVNKGQGITLKEGFNLLEGRAIHKELSNQQGQKYNTWLQLDFNERDMNGNIKMKQYHENYGFNLGKALAQYPIKELVTESQKELLLRSLQKGNVPAVTLEKNGRIEKMYVEANPKFKSLQFYDANMRKQSHQTLSERFCLVQQESKERKKTQNEEQTKDKGLSKKQGLDEKKGTGEVTLIGKAKEPQQSKKNKMSL